MTCSQKWIQNLRESLILSRLKGCCQEMIIKLYMDLINTFRSNLFIVLQSVSAMQLTAQKKKLTYQKQVQSFLLNDLTDAFLTLATFFLANIGNQYTRKTRVLKRALWSTKTKHCRGGTSRHSGMIQNHYILTMREKCKRATWKIHKNYTLK